MTGSTILRIDAAMRGNKVIYWLGRIPLIRRLVSDTLYSAKEGKLALSVLLWIWRAVKSFAGTFLYVGVMCVLPLLIVAEPAGLGQEFGRFCWLLLMLSFVTGVNRSVADKYIVLFISLHFLIILLICNWVYQH